MERLAADAAATVAATRIFFAAIWVVRLELGHEHLLSAPSERNPGAKIEYRRLSI
ncbi:MAG: hypothetical protein N2C13_00400 [Chloroflexota bacterium]